MTRGTFGRVALVGLFGLTTGCGAAGPADTADRFRAAAQDGDFETVRSLSLETDDTRVDLEAAKTSIADYALGEASVDGEAATVHPTVHAGTGDDPQQIEFETALVRHDGSWLVDLDTTAESMLKSMLGASMQEIGQAIADGMQEGMQTMMDSLADGMRQMGEAMGEAMNEAARKAKPAGNEF